MSQKCEFLANKKGLAVTFLWMQCQVLLQFGPSQKRSQNAQPQNEILCSKGPVCINTGIACLFLPGNERSQ